MDPEVVTLWLTVPSAVLPILVMIGWLMPRARRSMRRSWRRYSRWFEAEYGYYENTYLDATRRFDLSATFIPLSFQTGGEPPESWPAALDVLMSRDSGRVVVVGDPGSGKSTLLSALGVTLLRPRRPAGPGWLGRGVAREVPILVVLRRFARHAASSGLAEYIVNEILVPQAELRREAASDFLQKAMRQRRCVVLLDGLDEVPPAQYDVVRDAVHAFATARAAQLPTAHARIIITCRRQYFDRKRRDWTGTLSPVGEPGPWGARFPIVTPLAQLRNAEIVTYLSKLHDRFAVPDGPEKFMEAVHKAGMLDIHRTPLILAMSVGYYAPRYQFDVPRSISELYRLIIGAMLGRRDVGEGGGGSNRFEVADKRRLLQEFAFAAALGEIGFDQFHRADLLTFAQTLAPSLIDVKTSEVAEFVDEVIIHSGLLSDVTGNDRLAFLFAHRSIQEHLVAQELLIGDRRPWESTRRIILDRAADPEWPQVIIFYAAAAHQDPASALLDELAERNLLLAGACLAEANCRDEVADRILGALGDSATMRARAREGDALQETLSAMLGAAGSPRPTVAARAAGHIEELLAPLVGARAPDARAPGVAEAMGEDVGDALSLLDTLSKRPALKLAPLVAEVARHIPDDARLVAPLWRYLAMPNMDSHPGAARDIVDRLLSLAMVPECFHALQREDRGAEPGLLHAAARERSYPFRRGLDLTSNLVTLLVWADYLGLEPRRKNLFLEARQEGELGYVEDGQRRTLEIRPFWIARALSGSLTIAAVILAIMVFLAGPFPAEAAREPVTWRTWLTVLVVLGASTLAVLPLARPWFARVADPGGAHSEYARGSGHLFFALVPITPVWLRPLLWLPVLAAPFIVVVRGELDLDSALIILGYFGLHLVFTLRVFARTGPALRVYRPSRFVAMYEDVHSRHWVVRSCSGDEPV